MVALAGIGPIIPWRRVTAGKLRRNFIFPVGAALATLVVLQFVSGVDRHVFAYLMFGFGALVVATVAQEFFRGTRARAAMTSEPTPLALVGLVRRNRRRYGGYIVHAGVAIALVGVAASTSFQHQRTATLSPGQSVRIDGYRIRYVAPTASASPQKITFGAVLAVTKGGRRVTTLDTTYGLYPSQDSLNPVGRFFNTSDGASTESRVGLDSGPLRDLWVVISPNIGPLQNLISQGDAKFSQALAAVQKLPAAQQTSQLNTIYQLRDILINELTRRFVTNPWQSQFLMEVSPLVMWLWIGAIIAALGGLIALWPMPAVRAGRLRGSSSRRSVPRSRRPETPEPDRQPELV